MSAEMLMLGAPGAARPINADERITRTWSKSHGDADSFPHSGKGDGAPVPERLMLCGLAPSPDALTPSVALSAPTMLGMNVIV